ncbi:MULTISPECIES: hypothetical protein [Bradyrhizobium]|uniref:Uncharacterized protein n=1 Tax=Bradyrhizobium septentrionale TaxID=1404411 RepID=A0A973VZH2_9BRAD|nr:MULTISPECIES: hypothetical protein [Bradyrhizobium]QIG91245.1 hypothetical protein G6P99_01080 [Bradyrhizobium sp. 6(2017)]UGY13525.1 hypothetical protein HAP48_0033805 [Bradyrhizobium septentrionale]UGY22167.1 hypothetical protein HU675_0029760 [Bradyrhizobium septentrionale]
MTDEQDTNSKGDVVPPQNLKEGAETKISSTPGKDALGDGALDDVSGGLWPAVMSSSTYNKTI